MNESDEKALLEDLLRKEPVKFVCRKDPAVARESAPVVEVLHLLWSRKVSCAVLVADESAAERSAAATAGSAPAGRVPVGIFTERDFLDRMASLSTGDWLDVKYNPIRVHMTNRPQVLPAETSLDEAIQMMTVHGYRHLPIVDERGGLFGLLSARDVIEFLAEHFPSAVYNQPPGQQRRSRFHNREGE